MGYAVDYVSAGKRNFLGRWILPALHRASVAVYPFTIFVLSHAGQLLAVASYLKHRYELYQSSQQGGK